MAMGLVSTVAADGEVGLMREGGEQIEHLARVRILHFGSILRGESLPSSGVVCRLGQFNGSRAGGEDGQPKVVIVEPSEIFLGNTTGWAADGTEAQAFVREAR